MSKSLTISLAVMLALHASVAFAADKEPVLKAIDPSTLKLDDGSGDASSFNNTPVKGRPLGNTFQPINQNAPGDLINNASAGAPGASTPATQAGFGNALSPETDEPVASAQEEERVNNLEQKAFGTNYHEHEVPDRLDHLEKEVFGVSAHGAIGDRIAKLEIKLLGGTGFGAAPTASSQAKAPAQASGDGWLTQPAGTPMQPPQAASQSELQPPPLQQATLPPQMQMPQQQMQMPQQQMQMPQQQMQMPQQQMQMPQQQMQMPQQQTQIPPRQMQPPQNRSAQIASQNSSGNAGRYAGQSSTGSTAAPPSVGLTADASLVANSLFFDLRAGDYLSEIRRFPGPTGQPGQSYAHWRSFPVRLRLPKDSPESWQRALEAVVARWDQYVPVKLALPLEAAPVDVTWVNQLPPKTLAVTRLNIAHGEMRVIVYMLRPSYYPPEIPERTLAGIFMHELGHAIGLFGHSDKITDLMYPAEIIPASKGKPAQIHFAPVSTRDINTLKKVYESPALPQGVSLEQPLEWALKVE